LKIVLRAFLEHKEFQVTEDYKDFQVFQACRVRLVRQENGERLVCPAKTDNGALPAIQVRPELGEKLVTLAKLVNRVHRDKSDPKVILDTQAVPVRMVHPASGVYQDLLET